MSSHGGGLIPVTVLDERPFWWRKPNIVHENVIVNFDFHEEIELLVDENGVVERAECKGNLKASIKISGTPVVRIGLNEPEVLEALQSHDPPVQLEILHFHCCVERDVRNWNQTLRFVPPDDRFKLIEYRLLNRPAVFPIWITATERISRADRKVVYHIKMKWRFPEAVRCMWGWRAPRPNTVEMKVPVMSGATSPVYRFISGPQDFFHTNHSLLRDEFTWDGNYLPTESTCEFRVVLDMPNGPVPEQRPDPVTLKFEVPHSCVSGIKIMSLNYREFNDFVSPHKKPYFSEDYVTKSKSDGYQFKIRRLPN